MQKIIIISHLKTIITSKISNYYIKIKIKMVNILNLHLVNTKIIVTIDIGIQKLI
jgi:hypothetical protein